MTVKEIVIEYLKENGYDGLCNNSCGCGIDDLFPCSFENTDICETAYKVACKGCEGEGCAYGIFECFSKIKTNKCIDREE